MKSFRRRHTIDDTPTDALPMNDAVIENLLGPLLLFARQWDAASAEDIVQDAVLRLVRSVEERPQNVSAWLFTVVRNEAVDRLREKKRFDRHVERYAEAAKPWFEPESDSRLDGEQVAAELERLPREQREIIVAHLWGCLSFEEIGPLVGVSRSTAHRRYVEGINALRKKVNHDE